MGAKVVPFRIDPSQPWTHHECVTLPWLSSDDAPQQQGGGAGTGEAQQLRARRVKFRAIDDKSCQVQWYLNRCDDWCCGVGVVVS